MQDTYLIPIGLLLAAATFVLGLLWGAELMLGKVKKDCELIEIIRFEDSVFTCIPRIAK